MQAKISDFAKWSGFFAPWVIVAVLSMYSIFIQVKPSDVLKELTTDVRPRDVMAEVKEIRRELSRLVDLHERQQDAGIQIE